MDIYIDYREKLLIDGFNDKQIEIQIKNLELGDINIVNVDLGINLCFERKTYNDLLSSLRDGRYSEQKKRMLSNLQSNHCTYIIEGKTQELSYNMESAIIHTMYRDKMNVVFTNDPSDTIDFICKVYKRCEKNPGYFEKNVVNCSFKILSKKKDNITKEYCYILQLSQIPGISDLVATEIAKIYPTYPELISSLKSLENDKLRIKTLSQIKLLGPKKAQKIIEYIL